MHRINIILLFLGLSMSQLLAQQKPANDSLYQSHQVHTYPKPIEGFLKFYKEFRETVDYSVFDKTDTLNCELPSDGATYLTFIITKDGELVNPRVVKGLGSPYDEHCLSYFENAQFKWHPATINEQPVNMEMYLPCKYCGWK